METNFFVSDATIFLVSTVNSHSRISTNSSRVEIKRMPFTFSCAYSGASQNEPFPNASEFCADLGLYSFVFTFARYAKANNK